MKKKVFLFVLVFTFIFTNKTNAQDKKFQLLLVETTAKKFQKNNIDLNFRLRKFEIKNNIVFWTIRNDKTRKTFLFISPLKTLNGGNKVEFMMFDEDNVLQNLIPKYHKYLQQQNRVTFK